MINVAKYPEMRLNVMHALAGLADIEYQQAVWVMRDTPPAKSHDCLDLAIHVLFDDCGVLPEPEGSLGTVLVPEDDLNRLRILGRLLHQLITEHGDASDEAYLNDSRWADVVEAAGKALFSMTRAWGFQL